MNGEVNLSRFRDELTIYGSQIEELQRTGVLSEPPSVALSQCSSSLSSTSLFDSSTQTFNPVVDTACDTSSLTTLPVSSVFAPSVGLTSDLLNLSLENEQLKVRLHAAEKRLADQTDTVESVLPLACDRLFSSLSIDSNGKPIPALLSVRLRSELDLLVAEVAAVLHPRKSTGSLIDELRAFRDRILSVRSRE